MKREYDLFHERVREHGRRLIETAVIDGNETSYIARPVRGLLRKSSRLKK